MRADTKPLYVKLTVAERARFDRIVAQSGALAGRRVRAIDVVRAMIREAEKKGAVKL